MSEVFFDELELPEPAYRLDLHTADADAMRPGIVAALERERPDWLLVYGDTNSTLAGAEAGIAAGVPVAHVEAGLRSGDLSMPEERNRIAVDKVAAAAAAAGRALGRDAAHRGRRGADRRGRRRHGGRVLSVRAHRPRAVAHPRAARARARRLRRGDDPPRGERASRSGWRGSSTASARIGEPVVFPAHPRTRSRLPELPLERPARRAARLPRHGGALVAGARDRHRLGRPAEGGLLVRRSVRDRSALDGVGRHGRGRRERARRRRPRAARGGGLVGADARRSCRLSTATATRQNASPTPFAANVPRS